MALYGKFAGRCYGIQNVMSISTIWTRVNWSWVKVQQALCKKWGRSPCKISEHHEQPQRTHKVQPGKGKFQIPLRHVFWPATNISFKSKKYYHVQEFLKQCMKKKNILFLFIIFIHTGNQVIMIKPEKNSVIFPKIEKCKSKIISSSCRHVLTEWKKM